MKLHMSPPMKVAKDGR